MVVLNRVMLNGGRCTYIDHDALSKCRARKGFSVQKGEQEEGSHGICHDHV
jgi:hypothetical protein